MKPVTVADMRIRAQQKLPRFLFAYLDGAANDELTLRRNAAALRDVVLRQRVLAGTANVDLSTRLFGQDMAMPVALAPIGLGGLYARRGECQAVRAAEAAQIPFTLSTVSACSIDEVAAAASKPFWFQLYMIKDRPFMRDLMAQARAAGCTVLVFTVDMPLPGIRYRDYRTGLAGAPGLRGATRRVLQAMARPGWAWDVGLMGRPHVLGNVAPVLKGKSGIEDFLGWMRNNFDASISWKDLDFIREQWTGPLIIKGILDPDDAREAARLGADGLIVSNHGGRQLDGTPASAQMLPAIAQAVGDQLTVLADGGVRSGLDVLRMLALGAKGVLLGRAWVYALACGGEAGVERMLNLIQSELRVGMTLTGVSRIADINHNIIDRT